MKYFQKLKCKHCKFWNEYTKKHPEITSKCNCKDTGFIKGANITETIKQILDKLNDKYIDNDSFFVGVDYGLEKAKLIILENVIMEE